MGFLGFNVWFFRQACCSSCRCLCLCSEWIQEWVWVWAYNILRWCTLQPWKESSHGLCIKFVTIFHIVLVMFGTFAYVRYFIGISYAAMISSGCDDIPTEAETWSQFRRRRAVVTQRSVPFAGSLSVPLASTTRKRSRDLLEEAFQNCLCHFRWGYFVSFLDCSSFLVVDVSDLSSNDPAVTPINATRHQLVTLCRSICAEKRAENLESSMSSKFCCPTVTYVPRFVFIVCLIVHRIRWSFGLCGAHGIELISCCAPQIGNNWY